MRQAASSVSKRGIHSSKGATKSVAANGLDTASFGHRLDAGTALSHPFHRGLCGIEMHRFIGRKRIVANEQGPLEEINGESRGVASDVERFELAGEKSPSKGSSTGKSPHQAVGGVEPMQMHLGRPELRY